MREAGDRRPRWTDPDDGVRGAPCTRLVDAPVRRRSAVGDAGRRVVARGSAAAGWSQRAGGQAARSSRCPACRTSTRAPSCGTTAWSTPTTGARSTSTRRALLARAATPAGAPPVDDDRRGEAAGHQPGAAAAARPARAVHRLHAGDRRRAGRRPRARRSTAAARSPWSPGCRRPRQRRGGWGDTALDAAAGPLDATCSPGGRRRPARLAGDLLAELPGRAAGPRGLSVIGGRTGDARSFDGLGAARRRAVRLRRRRRRGMPMTRGADGWWRPPTAGARPGEVDYGYLLDDDGRRRCPTRARGGSRTACTSARGPSTPRAHRLDRRGVDRAAARRRR